MPKIQYYKEKDLVRLMDKSIAVITEGSSYIQKTYYTVKVVSTGDIKIITSKDICEKIKTSGGYSDNEVITTESTLDTMFCEIEEFISEDCSDLFRKFQNKLHEELRSLGFEQI